MNKIEKKIKKEIDTLYKNYGKINPLRLFSNFEYSNEQLDERLKGNMQEIDSVFKTCKITQIIEIYKNKSINGLTEHLLGTTFINTENDIEKIKKIITREKAELSKKLKKEKRNLFLAYKDNEKEYQYIFMPILGHLVKRKDEIDNIISHIRVEL